MNQVFLLMCICIHIYHLILYFLSLFYHLNSTEAYGYFGYCTATVERLDGIPKQVPSQLNSNKIYLKEIENISEKALEPVHKWCHMTVLVLIFLYPQVRHIYTFL
ncbi:MAG TPA: hypothetical protein VN040_23565, partial [Pseudosphingobacterium sp.]|nr:hypothetical protein [Pseudosphingobacterium sp.]